MKKILLISLMCVAFIGVYLIHNNNNNNNDDFTNINDDYLISVSDVEMLNSIDTGVVYFGSDDCPTCVQFKPIVEEFSNKHQQSVYYVNIGYLLDEKILDETSMNTLLKKYDIELLPTLINIKDSKIEAVMGMGSISTGDSVKDELVKEIEEFVYFDELKNNPLMKQSTIEFIAFVLLIMSILSCTLIYIYKLKKTKIIILFTSMYLLSIIALFMIMHLLISGADAFDWEISLVCTSMIFVTLIVDLVMLLLLLVKNKRIIHV